MALAPSHAAAAGWLPAQPATVPPSGGLTVEVNRIASNPAGVQAIAWNLNLGEAGCQSGQVTSRAVGGAWSEPSATGCNPTVAISRAGEVLVVWKAPSADPDDDPSVGGLFVASSAAGAALGSAVEIATTPYTIEPPHVDFAPDGTPTVAWMEQESLSGPVDIYAATRTGEKWGSPETVMAAGTGILYAGDAGSFAVGPEGSAVFAWYVHFLDTTTSTTTRGLRAAYRAPGETTWTTTDLVPLQDKTYASGQAVAFAPDGSATVAAYVLPDASVPYEPTEIWTWTRTPGATGSWQPTADVVPGSIAGYGSVSLAIDSAGNSLIAASDTYWDGTDQRFNANVSERPAGRSWSTLTGVMAPASYGDLIAPTALFDSNDTARVVFSSRSADPAVMYVFSHRRGESPFTPETGPPGVTGAGSPQLSVDQNGYTVATWIDAAGLPQTSVYDPIAPTFDSVDPPAGGTAGQRVSFTVAGGDDWVAPSFTVDFGDGSPPASGRAVSQLAAFGRQTHAGTVSHSYSQAGTYNALITLTDGAANSATTNRTVTINAPAPAPTPVAPPAEPTAAPPAPLPPVQGLPDPVLGKTFNLIAIKQPVRVKAPGAKKFVPLTRPQQLRFGAIVDATRGRVRITIADAKGKLDTADFYAGVFKISQRAKGSKLATLALFGGRFKGCPRAPKPQLARKKPGSRVVRKLWGVGQGSFRTAGRFSSATIRGTMWLTEDRCNATLTRVTQGKVAVRDFVKRRTVIVRAGKRYLAR